MRNVVAAEYVTIDGVMQDRIDRCQLMIFPVAVGAGRRLFTGDAGLKAFRLVQARTTTTGVAILTYEPARA